MYNNSLKKKQFLTKFQDFREKQHFLALSLFNYKKDQYWLFVKIDTNNLHTFSNIIPFFKRRNRVLVFKLNNKNRWTILSLTNTCVLQFDVVKMTFYVTNALYPLFCNCIVFPSLEINSSTIPCLLKLYTGGNY